MKLKAVLHALYYIFLFFGCQYFVTASYMLSLMSGVVSEVALDETAFIGIAESVVAQTVLISLISNLLTILVLCLQQRLRDRIPLREFGFHRINPFRIPTFLLFGVALNVFVSGTISVLPLPDSILDAFENQYAALYGDTPVLLEIFSIAVVTGITEEIVFRGLVHSRLSRAFQPRTVILISSVLFGMAHGTPLAVAYSAILGMVFAELYEKFYSVLPSVLCHVAFNATSYLLAELGDFLQIPIYLLSVFLVLFCGYRIFFRRPSFYDYAMDMVGEYPIRDNVQREILGEVRRMQEDRTISPAELDRLEQAWEAHEKEQTSRTDNKTNDNNTKET